MITDRKITKSSKNPVQRARRMFILIGTLFLFPGILFSFFLVPMCDVGCSNFFPILSVISLLMILTGFTMIEDNLVGNYMAWAVIASFSTPLPIWLWSIIHVAFLGGGASSLFIAVFDPVSLFLVAFIVFLSKYNLRAQQFILARSQEELSKVLNSPPSNSGQEKSPS
jgi:hypothetical protein